MLFSAHFADTSPLTALRRTTPTPDRVPGLKSARTAICAPFTPGVLPRPQLRREAMVACWQDEDAIDRFLTDDPTGRTFADGWQMRMELFRAAGVWPGIDDDMRAAARTTTAPDGPSIAITIGTAYVRSFARFMRVNSGLEDQFLESSSGVWGTAMSNIPQRLVATFTVWRSPDEAMDYVRTGAHGAAVRAHYDPRNDPTGHTFVTDGGFFGFRPVSVSGSLGGRNPIPEHVLNP